jgi:hypothetical protein
VNGAVPEAETENRVALPSVTVRGTGCDVIDGATTIALTVRDAVLLVTEPALLVTRTE